MVDVTNREELEAWLETQPREVGSLIAARAAWRAWAILEIRHHRALQKRMLASAIILPLLRGGATTLLASSYSIGLTAYRVAAAAAAAASAADDDDEIFSAFAFVAARDFFAAIAAAKFASFGPGIILSSKDEVAIALHIDIDAIIGGKSAAALADEPLWLQGEPDWLTHRRATFEKELHALNEGWEVWIDWYAAMLRGGPRYQDAAFANAINDLALWEGTPAEVNARIAKLVEEEREKSQAGEAPEPIVVSQEQLLSVASPKAVINASGKVDAAPNIATDKPLVDAELPTLPLRQLAIIATILKSLGRNAPESLKGALRSYSGELKIRGVQPILGLLSDMFAIVDADCNARDSDEWIVDGIKEAFARFVANHGTFMQHFPLSIERENVLDLLKQDEAHAPGQDAREAMQGAIDAANSAVDAGIADQNLADVLGKHQEALEVVISSPPPFQEIGLNGAERIGGTEPIIPANFRKRVIASVAGFALSIMALAKREPLGLTANLIQVLESKAFSALWESARALWQAIAPFIGMV